MKAKRVTIDSGKDNLGFSLEKKIREYRKGVDYEVDKTGNYYTILSEKLKKIIWPDDYLWYSESVVAIDRQGKIESWRIAAENPRDPYKKLDRDGLKEIMNGFDFDKKQDNNPSSSKIKKEGFKVGDEKERRQNQKELEMENNNSKNSFPTSRVVCGILLSVIGLISFLVIRKHKE